MPTVKRILKAVTLILIIGFVVQCLFDPFASYRNQRRLDKIQIELVSARSRWESKNIKDYSFEIEQGILLWGICYAGITVEGGEIVEVKANTYPLFREIPEDKQLAILEKEKWDDAPCGYSQLTIDEMFDKVQLFIKGRKNITSVVFDSELGYVINFQGDSIINHGLLVSQLGDSGFSYKFSNFQTLNVSEP